ncbi:MAG: hypothetical protein ACMXYC_05115, partial [Candidatus Woesearchaeota archaeon]
LRLIDSIVRQDAMIIAWSAAGFAVAWIFGMTMYYVGQWGGGDAKMMWGLGIIFGLYGSYIPLLFLGLFIVTSLICGAVLALGYAIYKAIEQKKIFATHFKQMYHSTARYKYLAWAVSGVLLGYSWWIQDIMVAILALLLFCLYYLYIFLHVVQYYCMIEVKHANDLVPGDWLMHQVRIDKHTHIPIRNTGMTPADITLLQEHKKKVTLKVGMPFVPAFFIAFILLLIIL